MIGSALVENAVGRADVGENFLTKTMGAELKEKILGPTPTAWQAENAEATTAVRFRPGFSKLLLQRALRQHLSRAPQSRARPVPREEHFEASTRWPGGAIGHSGDDAAGVARSGYC